jgi:hypothetical protein
MKQRQKKTLVSLFDHSGTWSKPYADAGWTVVRVDSLIDPGSVSDCLGIQGDIMECSSLAILGAVFMASECGAVGVITVDEAFDAYNSMSSFMTSDSILKTFRPDMVISATPCTAFTKAGTRHWKKWDSDGTTDFHLGLFDRQLSIIEDLDPGSWAVENPPGRLANKNGTGLRQSSLGKPSYSFHPWYFVPGLDSPDHEEQYTKHTHLWGSFNNPKFNTRMCKPDNSKYKGHGRIQWLGSSNKRLRSKTPKMFAKAFFESNS